MEMISPFDKEAFHGDVIRVGEFWSPRRVYRALISNREPQAGDGYRAYCIAREAYRLYGRRRTALRPHLVGGKLIRIVCDSVERKERW